MAALYCLHHPKTFVLSAKIHLRFRAHRLPSDTRRARQEARWSTSRLMPNNGHRVQGQLSFQPRCHLACLFPPPNQSSELEENEDSWLKLVYIPARWHPRRYLSRIATSDATRNWYFFCYILSVIFGRLLFGMKKQMKWSSSDGCRGVMRNVQKIIRDWAKIWMSVFPFDIFLAI